MDHCQGEKPIRNYCSYPNRKVANAAFDWDYCCYHFASLANYSLTTSFVHSNAIQPMQIAFNFDAKLKPLSTFYALYLPH